MPEPKKSVSTTRKIAMETVGGLSTNIDRDAEKKLKESLGKDLARLIAAAGATHDGNVFQEFIPLAENLKAKQIELDIMAADSLPSSIISSYLSDVLLPNSNGDLVSIIPSNMNYQPVLEDIYRRLAIPEEKVVFSLIKNGIVIAEFEQVASVSLAKQVAATESVSAKEAVFLRKPGTILPNISIVNNTYTVFPILQYEKCVGFIEVKKDAGFFDSFDWQNDNLDYTDVVVHPVGDYVHQTFGVRNSSKPLQLSVRQNDEAGTILTYDIDTGCSLLENSYTAWKTLSILQDSIVLASLIKNAQIMLVETEAGTASKQHIEAAKLKLRSLFEGQIAMGQNGMKSYLSPQSKPAYIYSFTSNGVGKITANLIGGEYNPGQLYYLTPFVNQFFAGFNAPKQMFGFTEGAGGLDGGGAVEQYMLRYKATVSKFKRLYGAFIKKCINNVLMSKGFVNLVDAFEVKVYGAYEEAGTSEVQRQQSQMQLFESIIAFSGVEEPEKLRQLRSVMIKQVITDKEVIKALDSAMAADETPAAPQKAGDIDLGADTQIPESISDELGILGEESEPQTGGDELPDMEEVLAESEEPEL